MTDAPERILAGYWARPVRLPSGEMYSAGCDEDAEYVRADLYDAAIARAEKAGALDWIELPDVPKEMEGRTCWKWIEGKPHRPWIDQIPRDFSRERHHCGGIWVAPFIVPAPPALSGSPDSDKPG